MAGATTEKGASVDFVREEVTLARVKWDMVCDLVEGDESTVKGKKTKYLPIPADEEDEEVTRSRYKAYLARAVFYGITSRTHAGMLGEVFSTAPKVTLPADLEYLVKNANGAGGAFLQLVKKIYGGVLAYGRYGILVDYPVTDPNNPPSVAQQRALNIRPRLHAYHPRQIINWQHGMIGGQMALTLLVLHEKVKVASGEFGVTEQEQYRVLRLHPVTDGAYAATCQVYTKSIDGFVPGPLFVINDATGRPFAEIPFAIVGAECNDFDIGPIPFYDIASINIAHYRNSADYEDACWVVGQPTLWTTGLTEQWYSTVLKKKLRLGTRSGIPLPQGAAVGLIQASENGMIKEAMEAKERQMVALGARLAEQRQVQRTLGEAQIEQNTESSILVTCADNLNDALVKVLGWAALFMGTTLTAEHAVKVNTDFRIGRMSVQERAQLVSEWVSGAVTWKELREGLRRAGSATMDDDKAKQEIDEEMALRVENQPAQNAPDPENENANE